MTILFDTQDALFGGDAVVTTRLFDVLRDWVGHTGEANNLHCPFDLKWSSSSHVSTADNAGPFPDITNGIHYDSGTASLDANISQLAYDPEPKVEVAAWVDLSNVPTPGVETELSMFYIFNVDNGYYLEQSFVCRTDGTIGLRARYFIGATYTSTHPDNLSTSGWTFYAVQWDHISGLGANTIYMDPGNNNLLGFRPGPDIPASTYDTVEVARGAGISPGDQKFLRFANLIVLRVPPPDVGATDVFFTVPGNTLWQVPTGITSITGTMWGGGGGGGGGGSQSVAGNGAGAGFTKATHATTPLENLDVWVGGGGGLGLGASLSGEGGGGGATSSIWRGATVLQVGGAGAGGGGGDNSSAVAGGAGGPGGANTGADGVASAAALPGTGGTQVAGGSGGVGGQTGQDGSSFQGGGGADGASSGGGTGGAGNPGATNGGPGGSQDGAGRAGGGGGGAGYFGGGGGGSSVDVNAGGAGGGGGSNFLIGSATSTTNTQGSGTTPGGTGDALYVAPVGEGGSGGGLQANGVGGGDGRVVISYGAGGPTSWRDQVRAAGTQVVMDDLVVDRIFPTHFYRTSEYDLGGGLGDRFIHDISGFLNPGYAPGGDLDRNVGSGPIDVSNSYRYQNGCVSTTNIHYVDINSWAFTLFVFFKQPVSPTSDSDWFIRLENDSSEFLQVERDNNDVTLRAQFSDLSQFVTTTNSSPLLDGSWHRLVISANAVTTPGWNLAVDGVNYASVPSSVLTLSQAMKRLRWGNIDVNIGLMGWANYYDTDILTTFTGVTTEAGIKSYIEARTDLPPAGADYYGGYLQMFDTEVGSV